LDIRKRGAGKEGGIIGDSIIHSKIMGGRKKVKRPRKNKERGPDFNSSLKRRNTKGGGGGKIQNVRGPRRKTEGVSNRRGVFTGRGVKT